jgi:hypothetical protein
MMRAVLVAGVAIAMAGCGDLVRQGRSPVQLVVLEFNAARGDVPGDLTGTLNSDVLTKDSVFDDVGLAELGLVLKNPGTGEGVLTPSALNQVTISRYRVAYRRADGRNIPGVDVPHAFDSATTGTVPASGTLEVAFQLVRHIAKLEAPLAELRDPNIETIISTIADVTFYGMDQAGTQVQVTASIGINFGNFADSE